jgi:hypothetical protein
MFMNDVISLSKTRGGILLLLLTLAPSLGLAQSSMLEFLQTQGQRYFEQTPREVLAFYYTWYGRPERHGRWIHWGKVDPIRHDISASTNYPMKGAYDSHDPAIMDWHIQMAKEHGLTGFIATWWGPGTFDDRAFELLIPRAEKQDFKLSLYWETAPGKGSQQIDRAVADLLYILRKYGRQNAFLKVGGQPVVFVYGRVMGQVPLTSWPAIIQRVRKEFGSDFLLIADGYRESYARMFAGVHTYNICGWVRDKSPAELRALSRESFRDAVQIAERHRKISCVTIIPGYDDTKIRSPGLNALRQEGRTYEVLWEEAIAADPDWVLITSWNEWHEGSEIEPSREDGDKYLGITKNYAARFRATPYSQARVIEDSSGPGEEVAAELRTLFRGRTIGVLPNFSSGLVFWLADAGVNLRELSWQDLLDEERFNATDIPLVIYAGGEHYVRSIEEDGDVIRALQRYQREGGMLLAMPTLPYPFFYDETGAGNIAAGHVGLPIRASAPRRRTAEPEPFVVSWESPPDGTTLTFHVATEALPGVQPRVAFPASGDQRWRPATATVLSEQDVYTPLATLRDDNGAYYGDGIVYVEHHSGELANGKSLYVWMRMPDILGADATYQAVMRFAARQIADL